MSEAAELEMVRLKRLCLRSGVALLLTLLITLVPLPGDLPPFTSTLVTAGATLILICYLGKLLYDTLFYDRYWP